MSKKKSLCTNPAPGMPRTDCASTPKRLSPAEAGLYGLAALLVGWLLARGYTPYEALGLAFALLLVVVMAVRLDMPTIRRVVVQLMGPA